MSDFRIPKIIHYCSFGGALIDEAMLSSWKKYCPDYEIKCWNEENFDLDFCPYVRQAYDRKKYAFVSDVVRLYALKIYGGIYLDTDVELTKSLDCFLENEVFFGFEKDNLVGTSVIGATSGNNTISELLDEYSDISFVDENGEEDHTTNVERISKYLSDIQRDGVVIYPQEYFSPKDYVTGKINRTDKTYAIHHFNSSWKTDEENLRDRLFFKYKKIFPEKFSWNLASYFGVIRYRGFIKGHKDMFKLIAGRKK